MLACEYSKKLLNNLSILIPLLILVVSLYALTLIEGGHQIYVEIVKNKVLWCGYWVGLGQEPSIDMKTGSELGEGGSR